MLFIKQKLESPTRLRIREQLGVTGNSQAGKNNNGRCLHYSVNCIKQNQRSVCVAVCSHKHTQKKLERNKAKMLNSSMRDYIMCKVTI